MASKKGHPLPKILIVDDYPANLVAMEKALSDLDGQIFKASSGEEALSLCLRHEFAVVLLDVQMAGMDGFETAALMREHEQSAYTPIIFVTAIIKEDVYVFRGYETGAVDYLFKPLNPEILRAKVRVFLELYEQRQALSLMRRLEREITGRKRAEEQMHNYAFYDPLTRLPNRSLFIDRLRHCVLSVKRHPGYRFGVLFLDLDRFKTVNDSLGHHLGDELLRAVASSLLRCVREPDTVARLGGDEFTVIVDEVAEFTDVTHIATRILEDLNRPLHIQGHEIYPRASIGIALSNIDDLSIEALLRCADTAMYSAKEIGGGCFAVFDDAMHKTVMAALKLETELKGALRRDELSLQYQPVRRLENDCLEGFEALIRWNHRELGLIEPSEFIRVAEDTGDIISIGSWVLREACCQMARWVESANGGNKLTISVNVSVHQLVHPRFMEVLQEVLDESGLGPERLNLEITESVIFEDPPKVWRLLDKLKSLGVHLHLDDFGTGYSSLNYLTQFPMDVLKVDRTFVSRIGTNDRDMGILRTILSMAETLAMGVIAEGIENQSHLDYLRLIHCPFGQGYFFSRPLQAEDAERTILTTSQAHPN